MTATKSELFKNFFSDKDNCFGKYYKEDEEVCIKCDYGKPCLLWQEAGEEPVTEEPVTEEPVTEEPVTEEPVTEEPVTEEPVTEEPVTDLIAEVNKIDTSLGKCSIAYDMLLTGEYTKEQIEEAVKAKGDPVITTFLKSFFEILGVDRGQGVTLIKNTLTGVLKLEFRKPKII